MTNLLLILLLIVGCSKTIDVDKLVERGGLYYEINSDKPFSGETVEYFENGQKSEERTYKNGFEDGLWTNWYENGQKMYETTFKDGKEIDYKAWDEDGNKK